MKKCPYCAEEIQNEAIKCRYCGEIFKQTLDLKSEEKQGTESLTQIIRKCPSCGSIVEGEDAIFCRSCETRFNTKTSKSDDKTSNLGQDFMSWKAKKILILLLITGFIIFVVIKIASFTDKPLMVSESVKGNTKRSDSQSSSTRVQKQTSSTTYKIIDSEISDTRAKVIIFKDIVVDKNITKKALKNALTAVADQGAAEIKNYPHSTKQVAVYAYFSKNERDVYKGDWVGYIFWLLGSENKRIDIKDRKLVDLKLQKSLSNEKLSQSAENYQGVYGPDGNFRTKAILPFEQQVYSALQGELQKQLELEPNPELNADELDAICIHNVAKKFKISEKTVDEIWEKLIMTYNY